MLQMRINKLTGSLKCGLNQGDPLSTYTFAAAIDPALRELEKEYQIVVFADDILIKLGDRTKEQAIEIAQSILRKYGLIVNPEKCKCTTDYESHLIEFMGANIGAHLSER